jgi:hypothetical protein
MYASEWVLCDAQLVRWAGRQQHWRPPAAYMTTNLFVARWLHLVCAWQHALALCLLRKCSLYTANASERQQRISLHDYHGFFNPFDPSWDSML